MTASTPATNLYSSVVRSQFKAKQSPPQRGAEELIRVQPQSVDELSAILQDTKNFPSPARPVGSGSSNTRAIQTPEGTLIDMTALNRVLAMTGETVTVEAGIRLRDLAEHLAADGFELSGGCVDPNRTIGGAISSNTLASVMPGDGGQLAASVEQITLINARGKRVEVSSQLPDLLRLVRMSYGLLGVVYAVKLRVRPILAYTIRNSKCTFDEFVSSVPNLVKMDVAVRASLMPFRDRVYVELRCRDDKYRKSLALPWKLRDWAANSALPKVVQSMNRVMPMQMQMLRDPMIDGFTEATHILLNNRLADTGSNAAEQSGRFRKLVLAENTVGCVWMFPVDRFAAAVRTYKKFSTRYYQINRFRCDLPAEAWRIDSDQTSLLPPSFAGAVFALRVRSTYRSGWEDFLLEFAAHFVAIPVFNQTIGFKPGYASRVYGKRLTQFQSLRQKLDPDNRFLNQ